MTSMMNRLFGREVTSRRVDRRRFQFQPELGGLEKREVLSAAVTQVGSVVSIVADAHSNNVATATVKGNVLDINLNGQDYNFDASKVSFLFFDASRAQSDTTESFTNSTSMTSMTVEGDGINQITAGSSFDIVITGNGQSNVTQGTGYCWVI